MSMTPYNFDSSNLPQALPIFPLNGVLLLPGGHLPLNIFEPRYLAMFDDALKSNRLIGMVQPRTSEENPIYDVGCAGKIIEFSETPDGRYEILLRGISRFRIQEEIENLPPYRQVKPDWTSFGDDLSCETKCLDIDRDKLRDLLSQYFTRQGMQIDWDAVAETSDEKLMTCLAMTCPFSPAEKQALLEEKCCSARAKTFMTMLEMELHSS